MGKKREERVVRNERLSEVAGVARFCQNQDLQDWRDFQDFARSDCAFRRKLKSRQDEYG